MSALPKRLIAPIYTEGLAAFRFEFRFVGFHCIIFAIKDVVYRANPVVPQGNTNRLSWAIARRLRNNLEIRLQNISIYMISVVTYRLHHHKGPAYIHPQIHHSCWLGGPDNYVASLLYGLIE